jgi:hypothetical protein
MAGRPNCSGRNLSSRNRKAVVYRERAAACGVAYHAVASRAMHDNDRVVDPQHFVDRFVPRG